MVKCHKEERPRKYIRKHKKDLHIVQPSVLPPQKDLYFQPKVLKFLTKGKAKYFMGHTKSFSQSKMYVRLKSDQPVRENTAATAMAANTGCMWKW